jgi:hypothetical protein
MLSVQKDVLDDLCNNFGTIAIKPRPYTTDDDTNSSFNPFNRMRWLAVEDGEIVMKFGKHEDRLLSEVAEQDPTYLDWMLTKPVSSVLSYQPAPVK